MKKYFLSLFTSVLMAVQPAIARTVDGDNFPGGNVEKNYAKNPSCEKNINGITASGGSLTRGTTTPLNDATGSECVIDASADDQTYTFAASTLGQGLKNRNCEAKFIYEGDGSLYKAYVKQGSTQISNDLQLISSTTSVQPVSINFPCGDLSSATTLVIESTAAGAAAISVAKAYLGEGTNLGFVNVDTGWMAYTPVVVGAGTVTIDEAKWRRKGDSIEIGARITTGTATAVNLTASLPNGWTIDATKVSTTRQCGIATAQTGVGSNFKFRVLCVPGAAFVNFSSGNLSVANGNDVLANNDLLGFNTFSIPISSLSAEAAISPNNSVDSLGTVFYVAQNTCPAGSVAADGTAVSRSAYASLFAKLGTTYGVGDGSTTFNLPDLRGIFVRGSGAQTFGAETYTGVLATKQNDSTSRNGLGISDPGHVHTQTIAVTGGGTLNPAAALGNNAPSTASMNTFSNTTGITLGAGDAETRPANIALTACISNATSMAPLLVGSVTSGTSGMERIERATVNCTASSSVGTQSGTWITAIGNNASGCAVTIAPGIFSASPTCTFSTTSSPGYGLNRIDVSSATALTISVRNENDTAFLNFAANLICMGPK